MSDIKRIQLTTISDIKKNSSDLNILSPSSLSKTTRYEINVDLFEPNAKSFPEFNYKKLLHAVKKKHKKTIKSPPNGLSDPFEDNDDDVERIAREFEKKYGGVNNSYSGVGKKTSRPKISADACDKGAGYDDNDSFIDNTEAYDELIPEEVDTVSGGFYINSGALEFKHLSNYERPEDAQKMPKPRKRILSTSSSSSESSDENDDEPNGNNHESDEIENKPKNNGHTDKKVKVLNISISDDEKQSKPVPPSTKPITKDKDKKVKKDKKDEVLTSIAIGNTNINNNDNNNSVNSNTNANNNNNSSNNNNVSNNTSSDRDKQIKTTTVKDMLRAKRDSILGLKDNSVKGDNDGNDEESTNSSLSSSSSNEPQLQQPQTNSVGNNNTPVPIIPKSPHTNTKDTSELSKPTILQVTTIKLPANVSVELMKSVEELKEISQKHTLNGAKTNFFDTKTMDVIMKIDTETRNGDSATRTSVFQYIEHLVPFTQKTIMGHIRKVRVQNEENKLTKYYNKLKSAVDLILPSATEAYKEECLKVNQIRSTMPNDDKIATNAPKMPRKRFPWNDNTRKLLFDLYTALKLSYNIVKPRKETVDSFIENYYKTKLIGLWPPGWMRLEELNKEIERRKLGVKKPKENKKPTEMVGPQSLNSVNSTINSKNTSSSNSTNQTATVPNQSNTVVDTANNITTKEANNNNSSSKSILSTNNAFTTATKQTASQSSATNIDKSNVATISSSNSNQIYSKTDKTESNYDINKKSSSGNTSNASTINLTNSLTITPVKTTGSASSTSKPLPSVENKVTITNVETSTSNTTNHHSNAGSKSDIIKSSKSSSISNNSNLVNKGTSVSSLSKQQSSSSTSNVISISQTGNALNVQSPTASATTVRKTSDYSINSIMSTATSSSTTGSNSLNLNSGHSNSYPSSKTPSSSVLTSPFSVNEIYSISNKVNETIENSIKTKTDSNNINNSNSNNNNSNSVAHKDSVIKVRSVANMNSSIRENASSSRTITAPQTSTTSIQQSSSTNSMALNTKKTKKIVHNSDDDYDDGDSDSSDVEFIEEDLNPKRSKSMRDSDIEIVDVSYKTQQQPYTQSQHHKSKNIMINKKKYSNKINYVEPKLNNYISNNSNQKLTGALTTKKDDSNVNKLNHQSTIDNDLDVSQIMKDLKELQELQQPKYSAMHALDNNLALNKQNQHPTGYGKSLKDSADTSKKSSKNS